MPNTMPNYASIKFLNSFPLSNGTSDSIDGNIDISSSINTLFRFCSPPAVRRFIISIVVNAIYGCVFRSDTHIIMECLKRITPSVTYFNPTTSISIITFMFRIFTSLNYSTPYFKNRSVRHPMCCIGCMTSLFPQATTRKSAPRFKVIPSYDFNYSTITEAFPVSKIFRCMRERFYNETTKALVDKIQTFRHDILRRCSEKLMCGRQSETAFRVYIPIHTNY